MFSDLDGEAPERPKLLAASVIPRLETPRLAMREWREEDLDAHAAMSADPEVQRYLEGVLDRVQSWRSPLSNAMRPMPPGNAACAGTAAPLDAQTAAAAMAANATDRCLMTHVLWMEGRQARLRHPPYIAFGKEQGGGKTAVLFRYAYEQRSRVQ